MTASFDVIVIGGSTNGLVAATVLARQGRKVLLAAQGATVGGDAVPHEFGPGYRVAPDTLDQGWVPPGVLSALGIAAPEVSFADTAAAVHLGGGEFLQVSADPARAVEAIRRHSARDAERWGPFTGRLRKLAGFLESLYQLPPPDIDTTSLSEIVPLIGLGWKFRALGREDMVELLRVLPMSVQDLLDDGFECEPLKAAVAAGAVRDIQQGPRSAGTSFVLVHHLTGAPAGAVRRTARWRDGPDALARRVEEAARAAGVTIRTSSPVARIEVRDDAVSGVVLDSGEEIRASAVVSTLDPVRTLLGLVDPVWLDPEVLRAVGNIKLRGSRTTVLFGVEGDPGIPGDGVVSLTPSTVALEQAYDAAKYGEVSGGPHVTLAVPTRWWPALAPDGHHVVAAHAQWTPFHLRDPDGWTPARRDTLADRVTRALDAAAPGFSGRIRHRAVLSPVDLEARYGLTEGSVTHGELTLDQVLSMRPIPGYGRYRMPIAGLYLGGAGAHPGPGVLGGPAWLAAKALLADHKNK
jgi:phytoene dehydrogenase-like protein